MRSKGVRGQTRKLSEIAPNFGRFLPSKILRGRRPPKVVPALTFPHSGTSRDKMLWATPTTAEVIEVHLVHFKPIFDPL